MIEIKSKVDADTIYKVFDKSIAIHRDGDAMKIAFVNLDDTIKRLRPDIQDEIRTIVGEDIMKSCPQCGGSFFPNRNRRYCSEKCRLAAQKVSQKNKLKEEREQKKVYKDPINEINAKAKALGMSY